VQYKTTKQKLKNSSLKVGDNQLSKEKVKNSAEKGKLAQVRMKLLRFQTLRIIVQLGLFLLFFGLLPGLGPWPILVPVVGLLGVPSKTVGDALGALQYMLYQLVSPWLALSSIFVAGILVGRAFCAWACPFGFVQDILEVVKKKHIRVTSRTHRSFIAIKYIVLAAILLISGSMALSGLSYTGRGYKEALGVFAVSPFNALSPADTLFAVIPKTVSSVNQAIPSLLEKNSADIAGAIISSLLSVQALFWVRIVILAFTLVLALYIPRGWCRYFCPQGAFSALLMHFSFLGLRRDPVRCSRVECRDCVEVCPMQVPILDEPWEKFTHPECIMCLKCVDTCSTKAIKPKFP
jgi:polyferredoxin